MSKLTDQEIKQTYEPIVYATVHLNRICGVLLKDDNTVLIKRHQLPINRTIHLTENFAVFWGLIGSDGCEKDRLAFTNSNEELVLLFLKLANRVFGLQKDDFRWYVYCDNTDEEKLNRCLKTLDNLQVRPNKIYHDPRCANANFQALCKSIEWTNILKGLHRCFDPIIAGSKNLSGKYLKGRLGGDGYVCRRRNKKGTNSVCRTFGVAIKVRDREFVKQCLARVGLASPSYEDKNRIEYRRCQDWFTAKEQALFDLHPHKKARFDQIIQEFKHSTRRYTVQEYNSVLALMATGGESWWQIAKKTGLNCGTVRGWVKFNHKPHVGGF